MGVICQRSENIELDGVIVEPSGERKFSLAADAVHFVSCRGKLSIENCRFQNQLDDCINIHGNYLQILRKTAPNKLLVRCGHAQHMGVELVSVGDVLELQERATLDVMQTVNVKAVNEINLEVKELVFEEEITAPVKMFDIVENASWYAEVLIKNCILRWNRARGMLINGRQKIVVDGCYFENPGSAICIETSPDWCESGPVRDMLVQNCRFYNCTHTGMWGDVLIKARMDEEMGGLRKTPLHGKIELKNNTYEKLNSEIIKLEGFLEVIEG